MESLGQSQKNAQFRNKWRRRIKGGNRLTQDQLEKWQLKRSVCVQVACIVNTHTHSLSLSFYSHYLRWRMPPFMRQCWGLLHKLAQAKCTNPVLQFNGHFLGTWVSGYQNVWILLEIRMKVTTGGDNWSYKTCKAAVKRSPPTNQHPVFLQARCPCCRPTNSVRALKVALWSHYHTCSTVKPILYLYSRRWQPHQRSHHSHWSCHTATCVEYTHCGLDTGSESTDDSYWQCVLTAGRQRQSTTL